MESCLFAVIPDETGQPAALFHDLEEAIDWGLRTFGGDRFAIRHVGTTQRAQHQN